MFHILMIIQYFGIAVFFIELLYVINQRPSRLQNILVLVMITSLLNFIGYTLEMKATNLQEAMCAIKVAYIGKPFIALCSFFFVVEYFHITLHKWIKNVLIGIHVAIATFVFFYDKHSLFYYDVEFVYSGLYPHVKLEHGIVYLLYTFLLLIYMVVILIIGYQHYVKAETKNEKMRILCLCSITLITIITYLIYLTGVTGGYDLTAIGYLISATLLLISMVRYNLFDALTLAKDDISDEMEEGLIVVDRMDKIIYFNKRAKVIFPEIDASEQLQFVDKMNLLVETKEEFRREERIYEIRSREIIRNDEFYGKTFVINDITERSLNMERLEKQTRIAEKANRAKSDFLARMSHEIRTPINSIIGMDEMILREATDSGIRKYATQIKISSKFLLGLINDILDSSKIESGKMEIIPVEYRVDEFIQNLVTLTKGKAQEKGLDFKLEVDEAIPKKLYGDDVRIRQVLLNLLTNAIKYTKKGQVTLRISMKASENGQATIHYEVADTGIGIKKEDLKKLFSSYERIEEEKNRNIEGTGLGMSIVSNLLKLMHSRVEVESVYGEGSTFSFDLIQPIKDSHPIGDFTERMNQEAEQIYRVPFTAPNASVLVVDDSEINRYVFQCLLKQTRIQITEASSGRECLELTQKEHFDIIFMDHMMPEMDGIETLHKMRMMPDNKCDDTPVIILTANAVTGAREEYLKEGFDEFLSKPLEPEQIDEMLLQMLPDKFIVKNDYS